MHQKLPHSPHLVATCALSFAGVSAAQEIPAFGPTELVAPPRTSWATNGGNYLNQRYSPLDQIDRTNVGGLKGVWRARLGGSGVGPQYSGEAQPIAHDGVLYIVTGANDVFALSIDTGDVLWSYSAGLDPAISTVCCGWTSRGVGIGDGRVYAGQLDGRLVALDARSGDVVWSVQAERWQEGFSITSAPLYYDGLVITGFAGAEFGVRGRVKAYDADDGSLVWTFYTIPGPGEAGHDTWPADNEVWQHGGATVWQTPAVDPELGLLYFSTGNPGPDFNGSVRAGDNLYSASIVAIDAATGEYRWHFQQVHHDIWDYDAPSPVVLFDLEYEGTLRKGLVEVGKTGWAYILDRTTGEPLVGIEERPVMQDARQATAATQPYPIGDAIVPQSVSIQPEGYPPLVNDGRIFTPFFTGGRVMKPGAFGGTNWPPSSVDPATGTLYVCANDRAFMFRGGDIDNEIPPDGERYVGGEFGAIPYWTSGIFAAVDLRTNRLKWRQQWTDFCYSGSTTTAGGLILTGRNDGRLTALDASDGSLLWEFQTGAGMNAPVSVFEHNGEQMIAAYSAGNLFVGSERGDSVWLFSLTGELGPAVPAGEAPRVSFDSTREPDPDAGRVVYEVTCSTCHGMQGEGGHAGGIPLVAAIDAASIALTVLEGRNLMPALGEALTAEQIQDVAAYVAERLPH